MIYGDIRGDSHAGFVNSTSAIFLVSVTNLFAAFAIIFSLLASFSMLTILLISFDKKRFYVHTNIYTFCDRAYSVA